MSRGAGEAKRESESKREWKLIKVPASLLMSVKDPGRPTLLFIYYFVSAFAICNLIYKQARGCKPPGHYKQESLSQGCVVRKSL